MYQTPNNTINFTLRIDNTLWDNFSSKPNRKIISPEQQKHVVMNNDVSSSSSSSSSIISQENINNVENEKKTIEEIISSNKIPLVEKYAKLITGDFKVNEKTKPRFYVMGKVQNQVNELVLAIPMFTETDIAHHLKQKTSQSSIHHHHPDPTMPIPTTLSGDLSFTKLSDELQGSPIGEKGLNPELITLEEKLSRQAAVEPELHTSSPPPPLHELSSSSSSSSQVSNTLDDDEAFARGYFTGNVLKSVLLKQARLSSFEKRYTERKYKEEPNSFEYLLNERKEWKNHVENNLNNMPIMKNLTKIFERRMFGNEESNVMNQGEQGMNKNEQVNAKAE